MTVRTRMAPSPTGEFHIGSMRTLLFSYALAKGNDGKFLMRIEDTDRERFVEGALERTLSVISDYGLDWDEGPDVGGDYGPYVQSERLDIYKKYSQELIEKGAAYYCFCSKERLAEVRKQQQAEGAPLTKYDKHCLSLSDEEVKAKLENNEEHILRLKVPSDEEVGFKDEVLGDLSFNSDDIDDQVLMKSDGFPTYHLAVVIDDHLMGITHVLRGMEWLPSTPKHILLYKAFGWDIPKYVHLPLLKEMGSNKKLSKRDGSVSAIDFLEEGYLSEALLNFLMFAGWNPGTEKEIYSLGEFIEDFKIEKIHKTDLVVFDREKLLWMNGSYIRELDVKELHKRILSWAEKFKKKLPEKFVKDGIEVLGLVQERLKIFDEVSTLVSYFYDDPEIDPKLLIKFAKDKERTSEILGSFKEIFEDCSWKVDALDEVSHKLLEEKGYKPKEAFMTLRVAISGVTATPPIFETLESIGKDTTMRRIDSALEMIDSA